MRRTIEAGRHNPASPTPPNQRPRNDAQFAAPRPTTQDDLRRDTLRPDRPLRGSNLR
jgi:hypothetical protein